MCQLLKEAIRGARKVTPPSLGFIFMTLQMSFRVA
ncbi:hypothetical protein APED_28275 [Acanthopleuribacter pedis]